jgi:ariadne-1
MSDFEFDDDDDFLYDESGEDFLDEDELDFTEIIQEKQEKKKYEVEYKVYSIEEIEDFQ